MIPRRLSNSAVARGKDAQHTCPRGYHVAHQPSAPIGAGHTDDRQPPLHTHRPATRWLTPRRRLWTSFIRKPPEAAAASLASAARLAQALRSAIFCIASTTAPLVLVARTWLPSASPMTFFTAPAARARPRRFGAWVDDGQDPQIVLVAARACSDSLSTVHRTRRFRSSRRPSRRVQVAEVYLRSNRHGGCRCLGFEWQKFGVVWADVAISGFRYLIPDAGDLTERFGGDQPRVV